MPFSNEYKASIKKKVENPRIALNCTIKKLNRTHKIVMMILSISECACEQFSEELIDHIQAIIIDGAKMYCGPPNQHFGLARRALPGPRYSAPPPTTVTQMCHVFML